MKSMTDFEYEITRRVACAEIDAGTTRRRIELIEAQLAELNRVAVKRDMARGMDYEQVHPDEMARLRRIERAAVECFPDGSAACWPGAWGQLREALKR